MWKTILVFQFILWPIFGTLVIALFLLMIGLVWLIEYLRGLCVCTHILQSLMWPLFRLLFLSFGNLQIKGKEHVLGHSAGAIFAVNHSSQLDPFLIPATLGPLSSLMPMHYVSRTRDFYEIRGLSRYIYGGLVFKILGAYPATVGMKDFEKMLANHIELLRIGRSVCIFPEGGIGKSGELCQGKPGVAYLLWRTGRPIIPAAIHGHAQMSIRGFLSRSRNIVVSYGAPITRAEIFGPNADAVVPTHDELIAATQIVMSRIREIQVSCMDDELKTANGLCVIPE